MPPVFYQEGPHEFNLGTKSFASLFCIPPPADWIRALASSCDPHCFLRADVGGRAFFETWCLTLALKQGPRVCLVTDNKSITTSALFDYSLSCDLHRERPQSCLLPLVPCLLLQPKLPTIGITADIEVQGTLFNGPPQLLLPNTSIKRRLTSRRMRVWSCT